LQAGNLSGDKVLNKSAAKPFKLVHWIAIMLLGPFGYTITAILALLGFFVVHVLEIDVPSWAVGFAFIVGMPVGALLELKTLHRPA
jgi:uncharacterized membrane protein